MTRGIVWGLLTLGIAGVVLTLTAGLAAADTPDRGQGHPSVVPKVSLPAIVGHAQPHSLRPPTPRVRHAPSAIKTVVARSGNTTHATARSVERSVGHDLRPVSQPTVERVREVTGTVEYAASEIAASTNQGVKSATRTVGTTVGGLVDAVGEKRPQGGADDPPRTADRSTATQPPPTALPDRRTGLVDANSDLPGEGAVSTETAQLDRATYGASDANSPARPAPQPDIPATTTVASLGESQGGRSDRNGGSAFSAVSTDHNAVGAGAYNHRLLLLGMVVTASDALGPQPGRQPGITPD